MKFPLAVAYWILVCGTTAWPASKAEQLFKEGEKAERDGQVVQAYLLYAEAAAADPTNIKYWQRSLALRPAASLLNVSQSKLPLPGESAPEAIDPALFGKITDEDLDEARKPLPPPIHLKAPPGRRDFDFSGDSKSLWEQLAGALHLAVVFDTQYQPTHPFRFQIADADHRDALHELEAATDSFVVPVNEGLIFIANDTQQKRTEFERTAALIIPFTEALSVQEITEVVTGLRGTLDMQKLVVDPTKHLILMRDRVTKVRLAEKLIADLLRPRAQVAVDVEILTTDVSSSLNYGLSLPNAFPLVNFPIKSNLANIIPSGYTSFLTFGGGASLFGLGVTSAELFATVAKSSAKTVLQSQIVALDGQPSSMHIGERYPIMTAGYFGTQGSSATVGTGSTGTTTGSGSTTTGTGSLQLSQSSVAWTYTSGGTVPSAASISVSSTNGTINYTAAVESSSPWLVVNNQLTASGTLPATLTISPGSSLTSLGTGSYQGTVQVSGSDGSVTYISVSLTVNGGGAQNLTVSPSAITLSSSTASGLEVQQTVSVTSTLGGTLSASVAGTGLSLSLTSTSVAPNTPTTFTVFGNPAGLSALTYLGIVSVSVGGITQEVQVTFTVLGSGSLLLSQSSIPWTYTSGELLPGATNVTVSSASGGVSYTATALSANSWLLVNGQTTVTGSLPAILTISPGSNLTALGTGTYTGTVQISGSDGSIAYLNVNLTVNGGTATGLSISPNPVTISAPLDGTEVQQTITVTSATAGTLIAAVTGTGLSLSIPNTAVQANTPLTFTLNATPTGLSAQNYVGDLSVTVAGVTQTVQVTFSVGAVSSGTNGTSIYTPPPTFQFVDLGLVLKITPHVHGTDEVSLDIDAEFKLLGATSNNGIPVIGNTQYESKVTVRTGEWAVLAGLMNSSDSRSLSGFPLLSSMPFLSNKTVTKDDGQTLIVLKPRIVIQPPTELPTFRAWTGSEGRLPGEF